MSRPAHRPAALLLLCLALCQNALAYSGDATAYGRSGGRGSGACGMKENLGRTWETFYAAINEVQYRKQDCGRCVRVQGARGSVVVKVVDRCAGCKYGDIDLSSEALMAATGYAWDRKRVSWNFTSCGGKKGGRRLLAHK